MTTPLPKANLVAVQLPGDDNPQCVGRVTVKCPYCTTLHRHRIWTNDTIVFRRTAPCSSNGDIRQYAVDLNLTVPSCDVSQPHPVYEAGEGLNDNAMHNHEPNWIE